MKDMLKKSFYISLGAASLTRKKAAEFVDELVKRGLLTQKDADKFMNDMMDTAEKEAMKAKKAFWVKTITMTLISMMMMMRTDMPG